MEQNRIVHLRLVNSDEVIGELSGETDTELFIQRPMLVSEVTDDKTHISTIVLSKYVLFDNDKAVNIKKNHIITTTDILDEIRSYYVNSITYNTRFVEPIVKSELAKVNLVMENILKQSSMMENAIIRRGKRYNEEDDITKDIKIVVPGSNTIN